MIEKPHRTFPFFRNTSNVLSPVLSAIAMLVVIIFPLCAGDLQLNDQDYFESQGLSVLLFHNAYHGVFGDEKMSGIEIILQGERIATNGDVRLSPTPEQWDPIPQLKGRKRSPAGNQLTASLSYPDQGLSYRIEVAPEADGFRISVNLDQPLPSSLVGKAGFNLEFLPTCYFGKSFILDTGSGIFPRHPDGPMQKDASGTAQPTPMATGQRIVLSPEDPLTRVTISSESGPLMLFDGRNKAQNGWFVVRTLIPSGSTQNAVVWHIHPNIIQGWTRPPVVAYNQVGYTPQRSKVAVIELDPLFDAPKTARVLRLAPDGEYREAYRSEIKPWGKWLRYQYAHFDFSSLHEPGIYAIEYAGRRNAPFRIAEDVYRDHVWQASLTESQARVVTDLALAREYFQLDWDETTVDEKARSVQIRVPDGVPDAIQQIQHGVIAILAQYHSIGHAIPGIIEPTLQEYTHLGDAASQTDGRIYSSRLGPLETDGAYSGVPDDRWAFTTHTTPLDYLAISSLAAASRVLRGYDDSMSAECLQSAVRVWDEEHKRPPVIFKSFNTTAGELSDEETKAAVELLIATNGGDAYRKRLKELLPVIQNRFAFLGWIAVRAVPLMDPEFKEGLASALRAYKVTLEEQLSKNPYGVPITTGTWGGAAAAAGFSVQMYFFHKTFPDIVGPEYTLRGFDYILGTHPVSNLSFVSSVGTQSKLIAYGNNRADYIFIPGGMIPGVVILQPDFPELKDSWPFLWYENEYVIDAVTSYILAANAANAVAK